MSIPDEVATLRATLVKVLTLLEPVEGHLEASSNSSCSCYDDPDGWCLRCGRWARGIHGLDEAMRLIDATLYPAPPATDSGAEAASAASVATT